MEKTNLTGAVMAADITPKELESLGVELTEQGGHLQIQRNLDGVYTIWDHHTRNDVTGYGTPLKVGLTLGGLAKIGLDEKLQRIPIVEG